MIGIAEINPEIPKEVDDAWARYGKDYITMLDYSKMKARVIVERYGNSDHPSLVEHPELLNYAKLMVEFCDAVKCCNSKELERICPPLKRAIADVQNQTEENTENGLIDEGTLLKMSGTMKNINEMVSVCQGKDTKQLDAINKGLRLSCSKLI